jgi:branched-chain amino acid aminotransferase
MSTWVWVDGRVLPADRATVAADDRGLLLGDGIFETVAVHGHTPFALQRHLDRLRGSAAIVDMPLPWSDHDLTAACTDTIAAAATAGRTVEAGAFRLRITVTSGPTPGDRPGGAGPTLVVMVSPAAPVAPTAAVAVSPWPVNEMSPLVGAKVTSRLGYSLALTEARRRGADEAVLINTRGMLVEGTTTNLFLVVAGRLSTPSLATGCLGGVTRSLVLDLVEVNERDDLTVDDLRFATEAFLTSTTRGVQPISGVEGAALRSVPGPLTSAARSALDKLRSTALHV